MFLDLKDSSAGSIVDRVKTVETDRQLKIKIGEIEKNNKELNEDPLSPYAPYNLRSIAPDSVELIFHSSVMVIICFLRYRKHYEKIRNPADFSPL